MLMGLAPPDAESSRLLRLRRQRKTDSPPIAAARGIPMPSPTPNPTFVLEFELLGLESDTFAETGAEVVVGNTVTVDVVLLVTSFPSLPTNAPRPSVQQLDLWYVSQHRLPSSHTVTRGKKFCIKVSSTRNIRSPQLQGKGSHALNTQTCAHSSKL
jgi:hypothetical protein